MSIPVLGGLLRRLSRAPAPEAVLRRMAAAVRPDVAYYVGLRIAGQLMHAGRDPDTTTIMDALAIWRETRTDLNDPDRVV